MFYICICICGHAYICTWMNILRDLDSAYSEEYY